MEEITFRSYPLSKDYKANAVNQYRYRMDCIKWMKEAEERITEYEVKEMKEFLKL